MNRIGISVVVPTYQRPALLKRCLYALTLQDYPGVPFEIIVVSDGPDQSTAAMMERWVKNTECLTHYITTPRKLGPAAARNAGWRTARGELVAFTDDDCIPSVTWLREFWEAYQSAGHSVVSFSGKTVVPVPIPPTDYELNISQLAQAEFITANCACTKSALEKVGGFDERFSMAWREDSDLLFKFIADDIPVVRVLSAIVRHPVRRVPWGISIREERKNMFNALLFKKFPRLYRERIQSSPSWLYYAIAGSLGMAVCGLAIGHGVTTWVGIVGWGTLTGYFTWRRLRPTTRTLSHVVEMLYTSSVIPLLSLYWNLYGAWKFRALLIP